MIPNPLPDFPTLDLERALWANGALWIAGIDEAGRGALAGPVAAAAVILPQIKTFTLELKGVRDSKKMTPAQRESWNRTIREFAVTFGVGLASSKEIDTLGILPATKLAAERAIKSLSVVPDHLLLDYFQMPDLPIPQTSIPKGDALSLSIAAASVLAKTSRDAILCELDDVYPGYGFADHKGYGTASHRDAIERLGPTPVHRLSFAPLRSVQGTKYNGQHNAPRTPHPAPQKEPTMTKEKPPKQFGLWPSDITPISLARGIGFSDIACDSDGTLIWREGRSDRGVLVVQSPDGQAPRDLNSDYGVRAGVGYGGGDFSAGNGDVYFVEAKSGRIYRQPTHKGTAKPITPAFGSAASPTISPDGKHLLYVHTYERKDSLAIVDAEGKFWPQKLVSGDDFYMQPCWHPDGPHIAWITWNHPQMPWDGTTLNLGTLNISEEGLPELRNVVPITGNDSTAVFGAQFSPDGRYLAYVSDPDGWWQLYVYDLESEEHTVMTGGEAEHGIPAWVQGMRTFDFAPDGKSIYFLQNRDGFVGLWRVNLETKLQERIRIGAEYTWMTQVAAAPDGEHVAVIASGGRIPNRIVTYSTEDGPQVLARSLAEDLAEKTYALPSPISWKGMDGEDVHGIFYAPQSKDFAGIGLPPLMVLIHGGPTGQRGAHFDGQAQFFASRGWAVLQVNYRGSTGYGRAYRDKLKGNWGIYDVQDAVSGAKSLVEEGQVDEGKLVIMGGSAGGFTVLKALEDYPGLFKAGVNLFGVANQFTLAADTHKFEERYSDSLLGNLPEAAEIYRERSPIFFADKIQDPIIVFQGEDDKVVPQNQSDEIVAALRRNGVPHEYHLYPGEGHGFRKTETIEKFFTTLEKFLKTYVIFG